MTRFSSRVVHIGPAYAPGMCPLRDATFCDEWDSLDTDCDGALSRDSACDSVPRTFSRLYGGCMVVLKMFSG